MTDSKGRWFNKNKYFILLLIIIFWVIANNFIWIRNNRTAPIGNALQDLFPGINFYLDIIHNKLTFKDLLEDIFKPFSFTGTFPVDRSSYIRFQFFIYPPLPPLSYASSYFIFGPHAKIEPIVNAIYLAIAMLSIYGIGKKICNEKTGLLAAFILSTFPGVIGFSRQIYAEFILMCMACLMLFCLLKTDYFKNRGYSLLFGVSLGLAALTKWEFILIMVGPFLWYLSRCRFDKYFLRTNLLLSILIGVLISFPWYLRSINDIIWRLFYGPDSIMLQRYPTFSQESFLIQKFSFYILAIINTFISIFYFLLLAAAVIIFSYKIIKDRKIGSEIENYRFYVLFLILWVLIPYLILSLANLQTASHILLVLPAIALVISLGISSLKNIILRSVFILLIILYGTGSYLHSFFDLGKIDLLYKLKIYLSADRKLALTTISDNIPRDEWARKYFYPPENYDWKIQEILSFIKEDSRFVKSQPIVFVLEDKEEFNSLSFQYYKLLWDYKLFMEPKGNDRSETPKERSKFDYVVIQVGVGAVDESSLPEIIRTTWNIDQDFHKPDQFRKDFFNKYKLIREYTLPDNTKAQIYRLSSS